MLPTRSLARAERDALRLATLLLLIDFVLISADALRHNGLLHDPRFAITMERGFGEWFQYVKTLGIVLLLLSVARSNAAATVWAALFAYLFIDDAFEVHENLGLAIAPVLSLPQVGSARPSQLGELLVFGAVGALFIVALFLVLRGSGSNGRWLSIALAVPFALLAFFGAAMDLIHSMLRGHGFYYIGGLLEDGGEMVSMSLLVAVACWATRHTGRHTGARRLATAASPARQE